MEKKIFKTLAKAEHKFGGNKYVLGRISGIQYVICDGIGIKDIRSLHANSDNGLGYVFTTNCSEEDYNLFAEVIESQYPGLCVFYYAESDMEK